MLKKSEENTPKFLVSSVGPSSPLSPETVPVSNETLLLHSVLSHLEEGVVVLDQDGHLSLINSAAQRMVPLRGSLSADFLLPESWGAYLPDRRSPIPVEEFPVTLALRGESVEAFEFSVRRAQGPESVWVRASAYPLIGPNHSREGCILFLRDVTVIKQMERDLLEISGAEKKRIGQDLHDGLCQILTGIKYMCNVLVGKLAARSAPESADVTEIQLLVSQALREADTMAKGMFPVKLEMDGLTPALEELASHTARLYRVSCRFLCEKRVLIANPDVALNVYRIAQEALTNSVKHGKAKNIVLWLTCANGRFTLLIKNDGRVSHEPSSRRGMGRRIMSSRADKIGATLQFEHLADGGTLLTCEFSDIPLAPPADPTPHETPQAL